MGAADSVDALVRTAIAGRNLLRLTYKGRERIVEPHDYGVRSGRVKLFVYQLYEPAAARKPSGGWRDLEFPEISACVLLNETFPGSRGAAHRNHRQWDVLFARVK